MRTHREARLQRLSGEIARGEYRVDPLVVADAIVQGRRALAPDRHTVRPRGVISVSHGRPRAVAL